MENKNMLKCSSKSNPASVAGAIAARLKEHGYAEVMCIGAASISQAVKSIAIASGYVAPYGVELINKPVFVDLEIDDETRPGQKKERTAIKFIVEPR
jgi:stage V sporulation protein S